MTDRIIDIYTHFMPPGHLERYQALGKEPGLAKRIASIPMLHDLEARLRLVRSWEGYQQVLAPAPPGPEKMGGAKDHAPLARFINEGLAEVCRRYPDAFPAFVAAVPLHDAEAAIVEMDYAVTQLGARGAQIYTNVSGLALDAPKFEPLFAALAARGLPAFLHPARPAAFADYAAEDASQYEIWQVLGWPYETAACVARLVFSGVMDRHPGLTIVTHHLGGIIPYLEGRIGPLWDQLGTRTDGAQGEAYGAILKSLKRRPVDYFRRLHADTAVGGSAGALRCGIDFFGPERVMFASDCPFDPEGGPGFIREGLRALGALDLTAEARAAIQSGNARAFLKIA
jgi:predicted TIM-barrel fold metal-dependent hydrolase